MSRLSRSEAENIRVYLRQEMEKHLPKWRLASEYIAPNRIKEYNEKTSGTRKTRKIINAQSRRSLRTFVSGMMNGATPRSRPWFNLVSNNPTREKNTGVKRYYSAVEKMVNHHLQIGNFYRTLPLAYKDVGCFSNAAFAMLEHARFGFYFYSFAVGTYAFACDKEGRTNMFTRDFTLSVRQVVETYGGRNKDGKVIWNSIPRFVKELWDAKRYMEEVVLSQVIVPNPEFNPRKISLDPADKMFQSYTFYIGNHSSGIPSQNPPSFRNDQGYAEGRGADPDFVKVSGYDYFPVITPRWEVEPEGYYGVDGPGDIALDDIMTLQEQEIWRFEAIAKGVKPPMVGHASLRRHHSSILAGGITYVDDRGMEHGFKPAFAINPQIADLIGAKDEIQGSIRTAFYEDLFLQLSSRPVKTHVTAAQIQEEKAESLAAMAPVLGQWDHDMSGPVIKNAIFLLEKAGRLPERPRELEKEELVPEYVSVLAQAAKASMIATQEKFINYVGGVSQALQNPSLLAIVNGEKMIRDWAENGAVNPNLVRDEAEYKKILDQIAKQQAQQAQQEAMAAQAQTAKTMSETKVDSGSMLDTIL